MLYFKGNTGVSLENLLTNMSSLKRVAPQDSVNCPTHDDLEEFTDKSFQNCLPQNDILAIYCSNISSSISIDSSTPSKIQTNDNLWEQFKSFKEKIEITVASLVDKISQQTQTIDQNKKGICILTKDNLHLKSRVAELETKVFPKDEFIILINSNKNTDNTYHPLENKPQPLGSTNPSKLKDSRQSVKAQNTKPKTAPPKICSDHPTEPKVTV